MRHRHTDPVGTFLRIANELPMPTLRKALHEATQVLVRKVEERRVEILQREQDWPIAMKACSTVPCHPVPIKRNQIHLFGRDGESLCEYLQKTPAVLADYKARNLIVAAEKKQTPRCAECYEHHTKEDGWIALDKS